MLLTLAFGILFHATTCRAAAVDGRPRYQPPTSASVSDPFRPPPKPWLPGNRGIEYATEPGEPISTIGPGTVVFAGQVAGRLVVTVRHPGGLRSSYVGLATVLVRRGGHATARQVVGTADRRFHLGVRRGDAYLDPASLWGRPVEGGRVVLVPGGRPQRHVRTVVGCGSEQVGGHVTLGVAADRRYTRQPAHHPMSHWQTACLVPSNGRSWDSVSDALGARSPKPLGRSGP